MHLLPYTKWVDYGHDTPSTNTNIDYSHQIMARDFKLSVSG